jgi:ribosomal protein S18 acetylase RimI-like enzyme
MKRNAMPAPACSRAAAAGLRFRPATDDDLPFLCRLYGSTRSQELAPVPWTDAQKASFLAMQFHAQHAHYTQHYPNAQRLVITHGDEGVGRLYIDRWAREHRLVDIAFLPDHCGRGYGAALLADLMDEAAAAGKAVTIHVEKNNPAMRLYRRLGFTAVEDKGVYDLMRWVADTASRGVR